MSRLHSDAVARLIEWAGPPTDDVLLAMEARAEREGFPTVGSEVGRALALCTRLAGARSVLELGSGFGYSAYWVARALPEGGTVTLAERDADLLADARGYFERGGLADRAAFEHGDAIETARAYADSAPGAFDLVVLDHDTADYARGFDAARELVEPGGAVLVDNVAVHRTDLAPGELVDTLEGGEAPNERTRAVAEFLGRVRADPAFETYVLPVGEGLAVCPRVG